jgi:hypothetical protein
MGDVIREAERAAGNYTTIGTTGALGFCQLHDVLHF